ncbi:hypothetical protein HK105_200131 [Polyrhizophydium stewartii]|uniref:Uncharacterized protein n=1 Tax=Polyrhizophydium stewartii TaxID=2732419 RepID=A0ABR4NKL5_9FUNG
MADAAVSLPPHDGRTLEGGRTASAQELPDQASLRAQLLGSTSVAAESRTARKPHTTSMFKKKPMTEIERLELENKRMEERLREFRDNIARQKAKRSLPASRESLWTGGDASRGSLTKYASDVLAKKNASIRAKRFSGVGREADETRKNNPQAYRDRLVVLEAEQRAQQRHAQQIPEPAGPPQLEIHPIPPSGDRRASTTAARPVPQRLWRVPTPVLNNAAFGNTQAPRPSATGASIAIPTAAVLSGPQPSVAANAIDSSEPGPRSDLVLGSMGGSNLAHQAEAQGVHDTFEPEQQGFETLPEDLLSMSADQTDVAASKPLRPRREYIPPAGDIPDLSGASPLNTNQVGGGVQRHVSFSDHVQSRQISRTGFDGLGSSNEDSRDTAGSFGDEISDQGKSVRDLEIRAHKSIVYASARGSAVAGSNQGQAGGGENLLNGDYDEQASRQSFLDALAEWRSGGSNKQAVTSSATSKFSSEAPTARNSILKRSMARSETERTTDESTSMAPVSTAVLEKHKAQFERQLKKRSGTGLSYMDKLLLIEMRNRAKDQTAQIPVRQTSSKPRPTDESTAGDQHAPPSKASESDEDIDDEEIQILLRKMQLKAAGHNATHSSQKSVETSAEAATHVKGVHGNEVISVQDVTQNEDEEVQRAFKQGCVVEVIPTAKMVVVEPSDE